MRVSTILAAFPLLAAAGPLATRDDCNTGSTLCCNQVQNTTDPVTSQLLGLLGISLGSLTGLIGLACGPLPIAGVGGNSCSAQPVCCSNNTFSGLLALGCNHFHFNLEGDV